MMHQEFSEEDERIMEHSSKVLDRLAEVIDGYSAEHDLNNILGDDAFARYLYCVSTGLFVLYLQQIYKEYDREATQETLKMFHEDAMKLFEEGGLQDRE